MEMSRNASNASSSEPLDETVGPAGDLAKMNLTSESRSIADRCRGVSESLVTLAQGKDTRQFPLLLPNLEDILDRFILWAGNMGAWHPPYSRMSLESRLSESPEVRQQISQLLIDLYEAIKDGKSTPILPGLDFTLIQQSENGMFRGRQQQDHCHRVHARTCYRSGRPGMGGRRRGNLER